MEPDEREALRRFLGLHHQRVRTPEEEREDKERWERRKQELALEARRIREARAERLPGFPEGNSGTGADLAAALQQLVPHHRRRVTVARKAFGRATKIDAWVVLKGTKREENKYLCRDETVWVSFIIGAEGTCYKGKTRGGDRWDPPEDLTVLEDVERIERHASFGDDTVSRVRRRLVDLMELPQDDDARKLLPGEERALS